MAATENPNPKETEVQINPPPDRGKSIATNMDKILDPSSSKSGGFMADARRTGHGITGIDGKPSSFQNNSNMLRQSRFNGKGGANTRTNPANQSVFRGPPRSRTFVNSGISKSWCEAASGGIGERKEENLDLDYIAPTVANNKRKALIKIESVKRSETKWENSIIFYIYGHRPNHFQLKGYIERNWKPVGSFQLLARDNGFFIIRFDNKDDCERILKGGPYMFDNRIIILKKWTLGTRFKRDLLTKMPIWVKLTNLELELWDKEAISAIASVIGRPIKMDRITADESRIAFAKVLIEMSALDEFPNEVEAELYNGEVLKIKVEYLYKPLCCVKCMVFGHSSAQCNTERWVPKGNDSQVQKDKVTPTVIDVDSIPVSNVQNPKDADNATTSENINIEQENNLDPASPSLQTDNATNVIDKVQVMQSDEAQDQGTEEITEDNVQTGGKSLDDVNVEGMVGDAADSDDELISNLALETQLPKLPEPVVDVTALVDINDKFYDDLDKSKKSNNKKGKSSKNQTPAPPKANTRSQSAIK